MLRKSAWLTEHTLTLRRLGIIFVFLTLALVIGRLSISERLPLIAGGVVGVIVLVVLAFRLEWGVLVLLATTLFLKVGFSTGTQSPITLSLALTAALTLAWIVRMLVEDQRIHPLPSPINRPLLAFITVAVLSFIWSSLVRDPLVDNWDVSSKSRLGALGTMVFSPAATWLVINHLRSIKHLRIAACMFVVAATIGLIGIYGRLPLPSIFNTRGLFPLWAIALMAGQALFNRSLSNRTRISLGVMSLGWFSYQFLQAQTWKSGWIPPLVAIFVLAALRSRKLLAALVLMAAIFALANWDYINNSLQAEDQESGVTRASAWEQNFMITREHLFLGTGPAGYAAYYMTYFPTEAMATHNNYIDVIAQTGLLGTAAFVWMLVTAGYAAVKTVRRSPRGNFEHGLAAGLAAGFAGLVVAMALGDWFLPFAYTQGIAGYDYDVWGWIMIGMIMILYHRYASTPGAAQDA